MKQSIEVLDKRGNGVFEFMLTVPANGAKRALCGVVRSLNRFRACILLDRPSEYVWNGWGQEIPACRAERCRMDAAAGLRPVSYSAWLAWSSPLNHVCRVNGGAL